MAKTPANKNDNIKDGCFEEALWDAANKLRGSVESSEYKHIVLSLIFLKFISDTFEQQRQRLIDTGYEKHIDMVQAYTKDNVFYLPEESRWSFIQQNAKQEDIALKIDTALSTIEKTNQSLKGALPDNYFSRLGLTASKFAALIDVVNNIDTIGNPEDKLLELSKEVKKLIDDKARYTDWNKRDDIKAELQFDLMILLDEWGYPHVDSKEVYKEIFEQAENFKKSRVV